ncbi:response regulator [Magnetospira sp. QH-2]|uniref:response regulator n=1 Tax=Magnetospira sp. (strain QH-2) TaxID=1288970 RepID=UPI0003E812A4|nr:response regulator [Magnetospira sp. QH-2]CCQ74321.1 Putative response regulator receiver protein [Magnetospira sp. QH-2]
MIPATVTVLLVDDDEVDVEGVKRAFAEHKIANPVRVARDGVEGLEILRGTNGQVMLDRPYLILLDINMPRMNGFEFLEALRADPDLKQSVVFMLTTSATDEDRARAYDQNIAGYIVKSRAGIGFLETVTMLDHYWRVVELPCE